MTKLKRRYWFRSETRNRDDISMITAQSQRNRKIADTLVEHLLYRMGDEVHSVILFGSVARGEANDRSNIDLYIISKDSSDTRQRMEAICAEVQDKFDNIAPIHRLFTDKMMFYTEASICRCDRTMNIIQGIVLHDDGAYRGILEEVEEERAK